MRERLDPVPCCFHHARAGAVPRERVFVPGEHFGGVHPTMPPTGHGGVVNASQGAGLGAGLALVDRPAPPPSSPTRKREEPRPFPD